MNEHVIRIVVATESPVASDKHKEKKLRRKIAKLKRENEQAHIDRLEWAGKYQEEVQLRVKAGNELYNANEDKAKFERENARLKIIQENHDELIGRKDRIIHKYERDLTFFKQEYQRAASANEEVKRTSGVMVSDARNATRRVQTELLKLKKVHEHVKAQAKAWKVIATDRSGK